MSIPEALRTLPSPVKIGAYDWSISIEEGAPDLCGQADFEFKVIRLWPDNLTDARHVVGIFLHECLHVIYDNEKLGKLKKDREAREEQIIVACEHGLVALYRDNPRLLTWMKKWLR